MVRKVQLNSRWMIDQKYVETARIHPGFDSWRSRQERRMMHQLNPVTFAAIPNALVADELSSGRPVGCWFCGVLAERFVGSAGHDADGPLWRGMPGTMVARFGDAGLLLLGDRSEHRQLLHRRITFHVP